LYFTFKMDILRDEEGVGGIFVFFQLLASAEVAF
jgi:hypothetical protein